MAAASLIAVCQINEYRSKATFHTCEEITAFDAHCVFCTLLGEDVIETILQVTNESIDHLANTLQINRTYTFQITSGMVVKNPDQDRTGFSHKQFVRTKYEFNAVPAAMVIAPLSSPFVATPVETLNDVSNHGLYNVLGKLTNPQPMSERSGLTKRTITLHNGNCAVDIELLGEWAKLSLEEGHALSASRMKKKEWNSNCTVTPTFVMEILC